jgi:hypothetical protein
MTDKTDRPTKPANIYINPNGPAWFKSMMLEGIFRDEIRDGTVKVMGAEEMQARLDEIRVEEIQAQFDEIFGADEPDEPNDTDR